MHAVALAKRVTQKYRLANLLLLVRALEVEPAAIGAGVIGSADFNKIIGRNVRLSQDRS